MEARFEPNLHRRRLPFSQTSIASKKKFFFISTPDTWAPKREPLNHIIKRGYLDSTLWTSYCQGGHIHTKEGKASPKDSQLFLSICFPLQHCLVTRINELSYYKPIHTSVPLSPSSQCSTLTHRCNVSHWYDARDLRIQLGQGLQGPQIPHSLTPLLYGYVLQEHSQEIL